MVLVSTAVLRRVQIAIEASFLQGALANGRKSPFLQSFFLEIHLSQVWPQFLQYWQTEGCLADDDKEFSEFLNLRLRFVGSCCRL